MVVIVRRRAGSIVQHAWLRATLHLPDLSHLVYCVHCVQTRGGAPHAIDLELKRISMDWVTFLSLVRTALPVNPVVVVPLPNGRGHVRLLLRIE